MTLNTVPLVWGVAFVMAVPPVMIYLIQAKAIILTLRENHPEVYDGLGEFYFLTRFTPAGSLNFTKFLLNKGYLDLADPELTDKANLCRYMLITGISIVGSGLISPLILVIP